MHRQLFQQSFTRSAKSTLGKQTMQLALASGGSEHAKLFSVAISWPGAAKMNQFQFVAMRTCQLIFALQSHIIYNS